MGFVGTEHVIENDTLLRWFVGTEHIAENEKTEVVTRESANPRANVSGVRTRPASGSGVDARRSSVAVSRSFSLGRAQR